MIFFFGNLLNQVHYQLGKENKSARNIWEKKTANNNNYQFSSQLNLICSYNLIIAWCFFLMFAEVVAVVVVERPDMIWREAKVSCLFRDGSGWNSFMWTEYTGRNKHTWIL